MTPKSNRSALLAGMLFCITAPVYAGNTVLNFSVDMTAQVNAGTFTNGVDSVQVRGTFNGWSGTVMTESAAPDTNIYTVTLTDTLDANPGIAVYKFWNSNPQTANTGYENDPAFSNNRRVTLPSATGQTVTLPTVYFNDQGPSVTNDVTFQLDMSEEIHLGNFVAGTDTVTLQGDFTGWGGGEITLTNDPSIVTINVYGQSQSNVFTGLTQLTGSEGAEHQFKYVIHPGGNTASSSYENPAFYNAISGNAGDNRLVYNAARTLPVVSFSDIPYVNTVTNQVVFVVDMGVESFLGRFASGEQVMVSGGFNGWPGTGAGALILSNTPTWNGGSNTNIYYATNTFTGGGGTVGAFYKFTDTDPAWSGSGGYEPLSGNRSFNLLPTNGILILPLTTFGNAVASDYLPADTWVTFTVNMTNAATSNNLNPPVTPHTFDPANDTVYINGNFLTGGWISSWNPASLGGNVMTNNPPNSLIYQYTYLVPKGSPVKIAYKHGLDYPGNPGNLDNEAPAFRDIGRVIRTTATGAYTLPTDTFGAQHAEPYFAAGATADGRLTIGAPVAGRVPVSWLGTPGTHLQATTSLGGTWQDHWETDGTNWSAGSQSAEGLVSQTNWPSSGNTFFRLVKPN